MSLASILCMWPCARAFSCRQTISTRSWSLVAPLREVDVLEAERLGVADGFLALALCSHTATWQNARRRAGLHRRGLMLLAKVPAARFLAQKRIPHSNSASSRKSPTGPRSSD